MTRFNPFVFAAPEELIALKHQASSKKLVPHKKAQEAAMGQTSSVFKTKGLDFQEVRHYQPGDDVRQIDWRLTAKYGKPFTKLYADERANRFFILSDIRSNMKFASRGSFKSVVCAKISAFLSWIGIDRKDLVFGLILKNDALDFFANLESQNTVSSYIKALSQATDPENVFPDQISLAQGIKTMAARIKPGSVCFLLSDFKDFDATAKSLLSQISQKSRVVFIHIFDPLEQKLPRGRWPVSDGKDFFVFNAESGPEKHLFEQSFENRVATLKQFAAANGILYFPLTTDEDQIMIIRSLIERA